MNHWFDGFAMLHRFGIADGRVSYAQPLPAEQGLPRRRGDGRDHLPRVRHRSLPQPLPAGLLAVLPEALRQRQRQPDPARRALHHDDRDADPGRVRRRDARDRRGRLRGARAADDGPSPPRSRHRRDAQLRRQGRRAQQLPVLPRRPDAAEPEVLGKLPVKEPAYMHSFGLTERWFVLAEFPYVVNPISIPLSGRPYIENYRWKPELGTRLHPDRPLDRRGARPLRDRTPGSASTTSTPMKRARTSWSTSASSMTPRSSRTSIWRGCAPASRSRSPTCAASASRPAAERSRASGSSTSPWTCRGSTTAAAASARTATPGASASATPVGSTASSRRTSRRGRRPPGQSPGRFPGEPVFVAAPDSDAAEDEGVLLSRRLRRRRRRLVPAGPRRLGPERDRAGRAPRTTSRSASTASSRGRRAESSAGEAEGVVARRRRSTRSVVSSRRGLGVRCPPGRGGMNLVEISDGASPSPAAKRDREVEGAQMSITRALSASARRTSIREVVGVPAAPNVLEGVHV